MVDNQQVLGGIGGIALAGLVLLMLLTGGGSHAASDPALCASVERQWDDCIAASFDGEVDCRELGERTVTCQVALQGGVNEPNGGRDLL